MRLCNEAIWAAEEVITALKGRGLDYSSHRDTIALQLFDDGLLRGNWDVTTELNDPELKDLRAIQEDEYDQHMDYADDKPEYDEQVCYTSMVPAYIWIVD
jgi:hypothetical protein